MRLVRAKIVLACMILGACGVPASEGAVFCVSTAAQLTQALADASVNGESDTIRLTQGTYVGNFVYSGNDDLSLEGGWTSGCAARSVDPANTVLDGNLAGGTLDLYSPGAVAFSLDGLTVRNGQTSGGDGGGVHVMTGVPGASAGGTVRVTNCIVRDNSAGPLGLGGGLYVFVDGDVSLRASSILGNSARQGGGAYMWGSNFASGSFSFDSNTWGGNTAFAGGLGSAGGGLAVFGTSVTVTNELFYGNAAEWIGGLAAYGETLTVTNNTIAANSGQTVGVGGAFFSTLSAASALRIHNNIIQGNLAPFAADLEIQADSSPAIIELQNNDFDQSLAGFGITGAPGFVVPASNLNNLDPHFVAPGGADYHLQADSPCRDAGNGAAPSLPALDHDRLPRVIGGGVDIGAYEYQLADLAITKDDGQASATPGASITYNLTVTNGGPSPVPSAVVNDAPPAVLTGVTWTCSASAGSSCTPAGSGAITDAVVIAPGGTLAYSLTGVVNFSATGTLVNTATVTGTSVVADPDPGNNTAIDVDNLTLAGLSELVHGSARVRSLPSTASGAPSNLFRLTQRPRSSYEIVVDGVSGDLASGGGTGPSLERLGADASTVLQVATAAGAGGSRSLRFENASSVARADQFIRVQSAGCTTACDPDDVYRIRAWETTYSASRFNNSSTQRTVLLVENLTPATVTGHAWFWGGTGALLGSYPFTLPARALLTLNTATIVPGGSGSITVSHDGPYGGLAGKAVAVEPASGFTFDTALTTALE